MYYDVFMRDGDINQTLLTVGNNLPDNNIDFDVESDNQLESPANPLSAHRHATNESLVNNYENLLELAPGEDKGTSQILFDEKRK